MNPSGALELPRAGRAPVMAPTHADWEEKHGNADEANEGPKPRFAKDLTDA